jgi:phage tail sheath protein FI
MAFLHGVETTQLTVGGRTITVVKSAVVMLIGFAPKGAKETLILVQKDSDLSQFGSPLNGFTIPQALEAIFKQGYGTVIVNNVYAPATNDLLITAEVTAAIANRKVKTAFHPVDAQAAVVKDSAGVVTHVLNTDYTIDDYGTITILNAAIADGLTLKVTYKKFDASTVLAPQIAGAVTGDVRTGLKLFDEARTTFGFSGKILICPVYGSVTAITTELVAHVNVATRRACTLIHAPVGTTKAVAIAGRGAAGAINFKTTNKRAMLLYPYFKDTSPETGLTQLAEPSAYFAGVMCATDSLEGPHVSVSNHEVIGPVGTEIKITDDISDPNSDANALNAAGISTISMGAGAPFTWGNRNASYPTNTAIDSFFSVVRVADIIAESIEYYSRPFIDKPISKAVIDQIRDDVNAFMRVLIGRGWIIDGKCTWDKAKNPNEQMAAGQLVFDYNFLPPPPLERLSYNSYVDITLFSKIVPAVA